MSGRPASGIIIAYVLFAKLRAVRNEPGVV